MTRSVVRILDGELILTTATVDTPNGPFTAGACSFTQEDALTRACSEVAERTRLLVEGPSRVVSTTRALAVGGTMREVITTTTAPDEWVQVESLHSGAPIWLPADLVLVRWQGSRELPVQQSSVGTAAHPDRAVAVESGARECLERYAVRCIWSGTTGLAPATEHLRAALPKGLVQALERRGLSAHAWLVGATLPAAVVVVMVASAQQRVTFGSSCAATLPDALRHALCEAVSVRAALASPKGLKRNFAMPDERIDHVLRAASFQGAFLAFLRRLEYTPYPIESRVHEIDILAYLEHELHVAPVVFDLGQSDQLHVLKVILPSPEFFVPRRHCGFVLAPGYLE